MKTWPILLRLGLGLLVGGSGPLLLFAAADGLGLIRDPNPNPIGLGLLFFFTIWPALVLTAIGTLQWLRRRSTS